ncbi:hypothetical protein IJ531_07130 [bacterium]|nr:hypothetical protein [bacterium]
MKKLFGFTTSEIIIVLAVLGVIVGSTVVMVFKTSNIQEKKLQISSQSFYSNIENTFREIVLYKTSSKGVKNLKPSELMEDFIEFLDGENIKDADGKTGSCAEFVAGNDFDDYIKSDTVYTEEDAQAGEIKEGTRCAEFSPNIRAGFYVDDKCEEEVTVKEFQSEEKPSRKVENACGYIIFEPFSSTGTFGYDLFVIAFGNRRLK